MSESRFYHVSRSGKLARIANLELAMAASKKGGFIWLDYCEPTRADLQPLVEALGIHPLCVEDCTDDRQLPKLDDYPGNTFILFNVFDFADGQLSIGELDLILGEDFLVSVAGRDPLGRPVLSDVERMVEQNLDSSRLGPSFLMHVILDRIVDRKFVAVEALEEKLDRAEESLLADVSRFNPADLVSLRRDLLAVRKSLFHEREILVKLCRKDCPYVSEKAIFHYRDVYDHLAKFLELTETFREVVTSLMEMYLSMVNNQMARLANETNITVRRLTLITTIFMPLTLLAGIGGMSEWSMMTGPQNWWISYPIFCLAMAGIAVGNYYLLLWLEKTDASPEPAPQPAMQKTRP